MQNPPKYPEAYTQAAQQPFQFTHVSLFVKSWFGGKTLIKWEK